jgi:hypothetical protein
MRNPYILISIIPYFLWCISSLSFSQEVLTDLTVNPILLKKYNERKTERSHHKPSTSSLSLPFLDDFSKEGPYPDTYLWLDSNVFINRDYPVAPPTLGVATFDGVSKTGLPYDTNLVSSTASYPADVLTSRPINLASTTGNVFLSFFWQASSYPYGRGNDPEYYDSLLLDFFNPTTQQWKNIWYKNGYNPVPPDTGFHLVIIPINDTAYLKNNFQFRFRNYATINGNVDHWHIDYVYLDQNRSANDTVFGDVAFVYNSRSLLKNYYAMPWEQYQPSEMKTNLNFFIRNNDSVQKNTGFVDTIFNSAGGVESFYNGGFNNILPYPPYSNYPPFANPPVSDAPLYSFPILTQDTHFILECVLKTTTDKNKWNDTLRFRQNFYNYYAYDDGTAEAGYGLNYYGGQIAYKFSLNKPDTLVAVQFLFNWLVTNVNQRQFKIRVWDDAGGVPGSVIYESGIVTPNYMYIDYPNNGNETNLFYPYIFSSPKPLPAGTFYVGWIQYTPDLLNIGYDENTNSQSKMFYNVGNGWVQSSLPVKGSWMIRPVFGNTKGLLSVNEYTHETFSNNFNIYPNPSAGKFTIQIGSKVDNSEGLQNHALNTRQELAVVDEYKIEIYNVLGEKVTPRVFGVIPSGARNLSIDLSDKEQGIYFLIIKDEKGISYWQKIIVSR